jgi:hypothetical protein
MNSQCPDTSKSTNRHPSRSSAERRYLLRHGSATLEAGKTTVEIVDALPSLTEEVLAGDFAFSASNTQSPAEVAPPGIARRHSVEGST